MLPSLKSLVLLTKELLLSSSQSEFANAQRDIKTLDARVKTEGLSFLTITLPSFAKDFDRCLSEGRILKESFVGFKRSKGIPCFLRGYLLRVFTKDGILREDANILAIKDIRQICLMYKKLEAPCSPKRVRKALLAYCSCDEEVSRVRLKESRHAADLRSVAHSMCTMGLGKAETQVSSYSLACRHGSGAVAASTTQNGKWDDTIWTERLEGGFFPSFEYLAPNISDAEHHLSNVSYLAPTDEPPVRVVTVPKTLKTPRIIAIEPTHMQFAQQGLMRALYDSIEHGPLGVSIKLRDQNHSRDLARVGSIDGSYATIDLSEASDRVSLELVELVFAGTPDLLQALLSSRSTSANVPIAGGYHLRLAKFASMGSAVCFPVESICFLAIAVSAILHHRELPPTWRNIMNVLRQSSVFGDDMIVPTETANTVIDWLETFGLKVNRAKTFLKGNFRESCGADCFKGVEVQPFYVRKCSWYNGDGPEVLASLVETSNQAYLHGYWRVCEAIRRHISSRYGSIPYGESSSAGLTYRSFLYKRSDLKWKKRYQSLQQKVYSVQGVTRTSTLSEWGSLRKSHDRLEYLKTDPFGSSGHGSFLEYPVRHATTLRHVWA